jgi:hypothetical protein
VKILWFVAWGAGVMGTLLAALNPSHVGLAWIIRIYAGAWFFVCGIVGFSLSFNSDLQLSEHVSKRRMLLRGAGIVFMAGGVLFLCLEIYLRGQSGW